MQQANFFNREQKLLKGLCMELLENSMAITISHRSIKSPQDIVDMISSILMMFSREQFIAIYSVIKSAGDPFEINNLFEIMDDWYLHLKEQISSKLNDKS